MSKEVVVCVSGYFDPLHIGHIELFEKSKKLGDKLLVIVNNDAQAALKKGKSFMPAEERVKIIQALKPVDIVVLSIDEDRSVCKTLKHVIDNYGVSVFANGGDRSQKEIPEAPICRANGVKMVDGMGDKIQSSSWLISNFK